MFHIITTERLSGIFLFLGYIFFGFPFAEYAGHIGDSSDSESAENERRRLLSLIDRF